MGVAPKRLYGWEPAETTTFEYDDDGRLIRSVTRREPEFDEIQTAMLFGYMDIEADTGRFGERISEAMSPEADPNNRDGSYMYVADPLPVINWAAKTKLDAEEAYKQKYPDANMNGLIFPFRKMSR